MLERLGIAAIGVTWLLTAGAQAQQPAFNDQPLTETSFPTEWAPADRVEAINRITPAVVMKATTLVEQGKTATFDKLYASDISAFGARAFLLLVPGRPTGGPFGSNMLVHHDELVTTEIGQIGSTYPASSASAPARATSSVTAGAPTRPTSAFVENGSSA